MYLMSNSEWTRISYVSSCRRALALWGVYFSCSELLIIISPQIRVNYKFSSDQLLGTQSVVWNWRRINCEMSVVCYWFLWLENMPHRFIPDSLNDILICSITFDETKWPPVGGLLHSGIGSSFSLLHLILMKWLKININFTLIIFLKNSFNY